MSEIKQSIEVTTDNDISDGEKGYIDYNAELNLYSPEGKIQFEADKKAARQYALTHVNPNTVFFYTLEEKLNYLVEHGYYDKEVLDKYSFEFIKNLFQELYEEKFRFETFMGFMKFNTSYAMKTNDGKRYLERYEDRIALVALTLADGNEDMAKRIANDMISGRTQPATPTFLNSGKKQRGEAVSCFLLRTEDNMESIANTITSALQLSKRGGGVGILLTNIREQGSTIKNIEGASSGVIPVMKLLEDSFSYANQLGARQGAGAVYISACHPDVLKVLDTKRENADEKIRIKTLSVGIVIPDIAFELARKNEQMYLFSPKDVYDVYGVPMSDISITEKYTEMVENPRIKKSKISARGLFQTIAELQFESGYPYLMFEDTVNEWNNINGRINMSNLCSEILQINSPATFNERGEVDIEGRDISCNLASLNIAKTMTTGNFGDTVHTAIEALTSVSDNTSINIVPNVRNGNEKSHSIGLGTMNLHGFLGSERIKYGSEEALDFTNVYFAALRFHSLKASVEIAKKTGHKFFEFDKSKYAKQQENGYSEALRYYTDGTWETFPHTKRIKDMFEQYGQWYPQQEDWQKLDKEIQEHGLYHAYLNANAPTGNISYVNNSTSSIHPIAARIETRKQAGLGRVYYPAYGLNNDNLEYYEDAYDIGYKAIIDTYAVAGKHVDQGQSLTLFFKNTDTTRDMNKAYIYAWSRGKEKNEEGNLALFDPKTSWKTGIVKTLYYSRVRSSVLEGTEIEGCVSCTI